MALTSTTVIYKQSTEVINVSMDFSNWLNTGVTISTQDVTSSPDGLTISGESISGNSVILTVSGGSHGTNYRIEITITTSDSQTLVADGLLKVRDR